MNLLQLNRNTILTWAAGIGVLMAIVLGVNALIADEPITGTEFLREQGVLEGNTRIEGSNDVAFYVNDYPVSIAETLEAQVRSQSSIDTWRDVYPTFPISTLPACRNQQRNYPM